jgi:WD40 repeat protein
MQSGEPHWPSKLLRILDAGDNGWVWRVMFSPDGRLLATGAGGVPVRLWDPNTGSLVSELEANTDGVTAIAFSPDGRLLATGNYDNTVRLWDLPTDTLHTLEGHTRGSGTPILASPSRS